MSHSFFYMQTCLNLNLQGSWQDRVTPAKSYEISSLLHCYQQHTFRTLILLLTVLWYMSTLHPKVVFKTGLNMLTIQVTGYVWADDTQDRCMMKSRHQKACLLFLWSSHTCWGICWTEMQNFAGIGISFVIFYCTAVSGRKAKYVAHPLMKINACSWISISLLPL